jgi:hypothetical protein
MSNQQQVAERNTQLYDDVQTLKKQMASLTNLFSLAEQVERLQRRVDDLETTEGRRQLETLGQ